MEEGASPSKTPALSTASDATRLAISQMDVRMHGPRGLSTVTNIVDSSQSAIDVASSGTLGVAGDAITPLGTAIKFVDKIVQLGDQIAQVCVFCPF
jgi:hypothetical protein